MKNGRAFRAAVARARALTGDRAIALAATMRAIASANVLPEYCDFYVQIPPMQNAYFRRVRALNMWLYWRLKDEDAVMFITIVTQPPVPTFDDQE